MDDEDIDPPPPSSEKVAVRAVILSVVSCRGFVDSEVGDPKGAEQLTRNAFAWLTALGLSEELSEWERTVLNTPFGKLSERDRINATWLSEAVVILAWALGKTELPAVDQQCDPAESANSLGFLLPTNETVLNQPQLRPTEEIHDYNEFIYNVHWRARNFSLNRRAYDFQSLALKAWGEPLLRHGLVIKQKDLCIGGTPISQVSESQYRTFASITQERHRAANWLIGYESEDFYEVTTDT